jgi:hypothetical protein
LRHNARHGDGAARSVQRLLARSRVPLRLGFWASSARAEGRAIVAPETPVRSAPFDVAPEIARLRAGDKVHAVDPPQGAWRRVALPDGRYGFVREADTQQAQDVAVPDLPRTRCRRPFKVLVEQRLAHERKSARDDGTELAKVRTRLVQALLVAPPRPSGSLN